MSLPKFDLDLKFKVTARSNFTIIAVAQFFEIMGPWTQGEDFHKGQRHQNASFMHVLQYSSETVCWIYFICSGKVHLTTGQHKTSIFWHWTRDQSHHKSQHHLNSNCMHVLQYLSETVCLLYFIFSGQVHLILGQHICCISWPWTQGQGHQKDQCHENACFAKKISIVQLIILLSVGPKLLHAISYILGHWYYLLWIGR